MKLITKLKGLWFFSLVVFGIGVLLELSNDQLNVSTLIIFFIYCVLYFIASRKNDQKSNRSI
jgi:hypothetical protein